MAAIIRNAIARILVVLALLGASANGRTLFVSPSGDNANGTGSITRPWKTITFAIDSVYPGDVLSLRAGTYHEQLVTVRDGTSSAYITITAYNGESAYIDGTGVGTGNNGAIIAHSYIVFRGFCMRNWLHDGMNFSNCHHVELHNLEACNVGGGISFKNTMHDFLVDSCMLHDFYAGAGGYGFDATPEGVDDRIYNGIIRNSKAWLPGGAFDNCDGFALGHDGVSNIHFYDCVVDGTGDGFDISGTDIVLERCLAHRTSFGGGYKLWRNNVTLINCVAYDNPTNVELDYDVTVAKGTHARLINCTLFNGAVTNVGIESSEGAHRLEMYNCILAGGDNVGLFFYGDSVSVYIGDYNLFNINTPDRMIATGAMDFSLDQVRSGEWAGLSKQDAHTKVMTDVASLFVDTTLLGIDLHLKSGCAAIDNGTNAGAPAADYDLRLRKDGKVDIGAYEFGSDGTVIGYPLSAESATLLHSYPQPAAGDVTIEYTLPSSARVLIEISDLLGRRLAALVDRDMAPGLHSVRWNATGLRPGIFICSVSTSADGMASIRRISRTIVIDR
jgi:hypothetical protein